MHNFKVQDYKKKGKFAYTEFKSFRGSRALEKLNATWHFEKSEDIHFLVLASSIVNYKKENIYFLICMLKVKKKKTHTHTHTHIPFEKFSRKNGADEVQAPNYTHVWEEEEKEDSPTCGLMDEAY